MSAAVAVVIPVRNGEAFLAETIENVLAQDGVDFRVHVVDNCSTDGSVEIALRYPVDVTVNEEDVNYFGSLNRALAAAAEPYFVPFAADDLMRPGNLALKVEALERTGAGFAHSTAQIVDERSELRGLLYDHAGKPGLTRAPEHFARIVPVNSVSCQSVVARTEALQALGGFDARALYCGDWLCWMELSLRHDVVTLAEPLVANRVHSASGTIASNGAGYNGRDIPASLEFVFDSGDVPAEWLVHRDALLAQALMATAGDLDRAGTRRAAEGRWAAYTVAGRALALVPGEPHAGDWYRALVRNAGLAEPRVRFDAVAALEDLGGLVTESVALDRAGLLGSLAIGAEDVQAALPAVAAALEEHSDLDVVLVEVDSLDRLLEPGRILLAPFGAETIERAESRGVPVHPFSLPDPFAAPPDLRRWQRLASGRFAA